MNNDPIETSNYKRFDYYVVSVKIKMNSQIIRIFFFGLFLVIVGAAFCEDKCINIPTNSTRWCQTTR